jgi:hypothetical protein
VLLADILVIKPRLRIAPRHIEHRRGYLANWGVPALTSLLAGAILGSILSMAGIPNAVAGAILGDVLALGIGFGGPIILELATKARFARLARDPDPNWVDDFSRDDEQMEAAENMLPCGKCGERVMRQDMVTCPVTDTHVLCSVCCAAHRSCGERCKTDVFVPSDGEIRRHLEVIAVRHGTEPVEPA